MDAYMYQADLYCEECGEKIKADLKATCAVPENPSDEATFDSDDYPKGPFPDGGGESDCPQHCGGCGVFLENPLTSDGYNYVEEAIQEQIALNPVVAEWLYKSH
jgi:hypothetical protein